MQEYQYQRYNQYFAQFGPGIETIGETELTELGAAEIKSAFRGAWFKADQATSYRITYQSRLATRILAPLVSFDCHSANYLYKTGRSLDWQDFLKPKMTFAIHAQVSNSRITHSQYAALKLKDAIVDTLRERTGSRPNIDRRRPHIWFNLHLENNRAVISLDLGGGALHRRGYRQDGLDAPMQETLAAAIIRLSGWQGATPFIDPMCGSGTLLSEALLYARNIPAAFLRKSFGFQRLPDFNPKTWARIQHEGLDAVTEIPIGLIQGADRDQRAIEATRQNLTKIPGGSGITLSHRPFEQYEPQPGTLLVCNPPYGQRLEKGRDLSGFYKAFGDYLKQHCTGSTALVYFGDRQYLKSIGLRPKWRQALKNGGLDGRLALFELY